ncbi:sigma-54 interaction domain-containing protein [Sporomusa malonica]|uniref:Transcriptional regulator containing PAS, AAA-type ATPase, and DNA-binding Fis domains n=1 Tax=Sporomusa malonica TaxID=112901 RepID=A0A1W1ZCQ6_9FIRM|nr:sigma 54-interacting transcriptional regulator [Sporomusa malonica]SMC46052.1 Transcriptional regulator containing PAS, AAA-type ATPase, and DNA-binding Fis domains [Sporomusa malonica]
MDSLAQIKDVVQQFAEAANAALKLDVEIFDREARIAGTGKARALVGRPILKDGVINRFVFGTDVQQKKIIVNNPGLEAACKPCRMKGTCYYKKAVYAVIEFEERIIGVIGVVAENKEQSDLIEYNNYAMLDFVDKIANLISSKVKENQMMKQLETDAKFMNMVIDNINKGVIVLDKKYKIVNINNYLIQKIKRNKNELLGAYIEDIFPALQLNKEHQNEYQEIVYNIQNQNIYLLCNLKSIVVKEELLGSICLVEDYKDTTQMAYATASKQNDITLKDIIGEDPKFVKFKEKVRIVSSNESTVLLIGETGTGKELFARAIHCESQRKDHPFIAINCGAIPETLLESELFGYEKGAFTGASNMGKHGKFFMANKGTLFLDEIDTMPLYLQPKLLRAIERREIERIGGVKSIPIDVRIVAATNARLLDMVQNKQFREDLYHRLNVITLFIPPLRERGNDVLVLADYFIKKYAKRFNKTILGLSQEVKNIFMSYEWKGNVRELQNTIEYAINMEKEQYITEDNLPFQFREIKVENVVKTLKEIEELSIKKALDRFGWTEAGRIKAAEYLGISRATVYRKIRKLHLGGMEI